jgi:hypothetical protein
MPVPARFECAFPFRSDRQLPNVPPDLKILPFRPDKFGSPEPTADQQSQDGPVALAPNGVRRQALQQPLGLFDGQPIADPHAKALGTLHATNAGGKFRTQQARVSRLVEGARLFCSRKNRYRSTTVRLNANRGSQQYQPMNSSIAWP